MKKSTKITIAIIAILGVAILVGGAIWFFSVLNKEKTPITTSQFTTTMQQKGYSILDAIDQFAGYNQVREAYLAIDSTYTYQIEFYQLTDEASAISFCNNNAARFESQKSNSAIETNVNGKNFSKYTLVSGGRYMVVSRVENTAIYINVDVAYQDTVNDILDEFDY